MTIVNVQKVWEDSGLLEGLHEQLKKMRDIIIKQGAAEAMATHLVNDYLFHLAASTEREVIKMLGEALGLDTQLATKEEILEEVEEDRDRMN